MFTGWFLVNVLAPILLPVVGVLPFLLLPLQPAPESARLIAPVKDGQLCWAVIAMGAATVYELWVAREGHHEMPWWSGFALAGDIFIMLPAMVMAAGGAVFSTPLKSTKGDGLIAWLRHYRMFVASALMTIIAAVVFTTLHFSLPGEADRGKTNAPRSQTQS